MRERESIFQDYVSDLRRKEKEDKASQKEKVSMNYFGKGSERKCQWINVLGMTDRILKTTNWPYHINQLSQFSATRLSLKYLKPVSLFL